MLHFRDGTGAEADAVIELPDGTWAAVKAKLSAERADEAAAALLVIAADRFGHTRDDGVAIVPITALGPEIVGVGHARDRVPHRLAHTVATILGGCN